MRVHAAILLTKMADVSAAGASMREFVTPIVYALGGIASLVAVFFLINGGIHYMTSSGHPEKLEHAKKIIRNALIGLVLVLGATVLTGILTHAYQSSGGSGLNQLPTLNAIPPAHANSGLINVLIDAIVSLFKQIVQTAAMPFLDALKYFTSATPYMAANSAVFELWLAIVGIADALFILVVCLLGFHVMSAPTLGLDEIEFKHLLPQLGLTFFLMNASIFAIDAVIGLSNGMIRALYAAFPIGAVWIALEAVVSQAGGMGLVALLIMIVFLVLVAILLVYYVTRLVTLYLGAVLSPLVVLLWMVPSFKDFALAAIKTYVATIFVLFIHVVILLLAASLFVGMLASSPNHALDPIMSGIVGLATVVALLKTQGILTQFSYFSAGPRGMRKLGGQFMTSVTYIRKHVKSSIPSKPSSEAPLPEGASS